MNRRFKKTIFRYDPLAYRGVKRFSQDEQPHAAKCQCDACKDALALVIKITKAKLTPAQYAQWCENRLGEDTDTGITYLRNSERKPKPTKGLKWNDPNRPYELANSNRSSASWRGGVYTQVRTAPSYTVDSTDPDNPVITLTPVVTPTVTPTPTQLPMVTGRKMTSRESRYAARMARYNARNAKQIVTSSNPRITLIQSKYKRNGSVIDPNNHVDREPRVI